MSRLNMAKPVWIDLHPGYVLLTLAYMVAIYWLSSTPELASKGGGPVVRLVSNLLHIPVYAGLTFCVREALAGGDVKLRRPVLSIVAFLTAASYAALEEWQQSLVPGRSASVGDFALDLVGIVGMLLILRFRSFREVDR